MWLASFSQAGENYYRGGRSILQVSNTEVLARIVNDLIDCDLERAAAASDGRGGANL